METMGVIRKFRNSISFLRTLMKFVKNSPTIVYNIISGKELTPLEVELKSGRKFFIKNIYDLYGLLSLLQKGWKVKEVCDSDSIVLCKEVCLKIRTIKGADILHITEIYEDKIYGNAFKGVIIDVGASNADSSIFFAINGAEKVIALEPFPESYELGEYNIKINNLDHKIILLPYALSDHDGYTDFVISSENPNANTFNPSPYVEKLGIKFEQKIKVPTITLPSIIQKYNINKIFLLKMDCEGCEYNVLRNLPEDILNRIDNIILEYHNQIQDLPDILKRVGFTVEYDNKPTGLMKAYKNNNGLI